MNSINNLSAFAMEARTSKMRTLGTLEEALVTYPNVQLTQKSSGLIIWSNEEPSNRILLMFSTKVKDDIANGTLTYDKLGALVLNEIHGVDENGVAYDKPIIRLTYPANSTAPVKLDVAKITATKTIERKRSLSNTLGFELV